MRRRVGNNHQLAETKLRVKEDRTEGNGDYQKEKRAMRHFGSTKGRKKDVCTCMCMYVSIWVHMYVYLRICICVCVYMYIRCVYCMCMCMCILSVCIFVPKYVHV
uniref:Transmembrane protein n=1 Tax=Haemonchus contortus TaxID=6289 RepID=A0A7I4XW62_HAECO